MALSATLLDQTILGNKRVQFYSCVADAATGTFSTNLGFVDCIQATPKSMTTAAGKFVCNAGTTGTAIVGTVSVTGVVSGDEFYLTVYGR